MPRHILPSLILCIFLIFSLQASSKYISPSATITTTLQNNSVNITITITNLGDESAYSVNPVIAIFNNTLSGDVKQILKPQESSTWQFTESVNSTKSGEYPVLLKTSYKDANSYKFSSLTLHKLSIGRYRQSSIIGKAENIILNKESEIKVTFKNTDSIQHSLKIKLLLPDEISADETSRGILILPNQEKEITFKIKNFSALKESNYLYYILAEYETQSEHYLESFSGIITIPGIAKPQGSILKNKTLLILVGSLTILTVLYLISKNGKSINNNSDTQ